MSRFAINDRVRLGTAEVTISRVECGFSGTPHYGFSFRQGDAFGFGWMPEPIFEAIAQPGWHHGLPNDKWQVQVSGGRGDRTWDTEFTVVAHTIDDALMEANRRLLQQSPGEAMITDINHE